MDNPEESIILDHNFLVADPPQKDSILIILNQEISAEKLFKRLVALSTIIICTDGAANRLRNFDESIIPDYIIGDFDSIT